MNALVKIDETQVSIFITAPDSTRVLVTPPATEVVKVIDPRGRDGYGIPAGGDTGQVLRKLSDDDYDFYWSEGGGGGGGGVIDWADVLNKPSNFPPSAHTHSYESLTGKPTSFPPSAHNQPWSSITEKPTTFPPSAHSHSWSDISNPPATFPPSAHNHVAADITDLAPLLAAKASLAGATFTGPVNVTTQTAGNASTLAASTAFVAQALANLVGSSPGVLDTLQEIAAALGDDPNFAATMTTALAEKLVKANNLSDLTDYHAALTNLGVSALGQTLFEIANAAAARAALGLIIGTDVAAANHGHDNAVASGAAGFMSGADKAKLDGVETGATANASNAALRDRATHTGMQAIDSITGLQTAIDGLQVISAKNMANGYAGLDAYGKIDSSQLPALAITKTNVVASQAAQLALANEEGDVVIRTDLSKTFIRNDGTSGTMTDYNELLQPGAPVSSVNGKTGSITLVTTDIAEGSNLYFTTTRAINAITGVLTATATVQFSYAGGQLTADVRDSSVTNAKLATMAQATIKGRASGAGTGAPVDLTGAQARTILNVEDGATANSPDSVLVNRGNHYGTQLANTISNFDAAVSTYLDTAFRTYLNAKLDISTGLSKYDDGSIIHVFGNRLAISAPRTYYVDGTYGNDAYDGLALPFKTIQKAIDTICDTLDLRNAAMYIQIADGTYTNAVELKPIVGKGTIGIYGNASNISAVHINQSAGTAIYGDAARGYSINNVKISATGYGLMAVNGSYIQYAGIDFGLCTSGHMYIASNSRITVSGNYKISGSATFHCLIDPTGVLFSDVMTIELAAGLSLTFFYYCSFGAIFARQCTFTAIGGGAPPTFDGTAYSVQLNGILNLIGSPPTSIPAYGAGVVYTGGQVLT